jgi:TolB-like protein
MAKLFLSYSRDDMDVATKLARALERTGHEVWWDALIEGGARYSKSIGEALEAADAVIVLWSSRSVESDWVRDEAAQGRERHRLVPLSLDGAIPPLGFRQIQTLDLSHWHGRVDAPQFRSVERAISIALGHEAQAQVRAPLRRLSRRHAIGGGAAAALALGGALTAWKTGLFGSGHRTALSIAVLPFKNLSGDPGRAYLPDGLTEEIRSALARNAGLMVLAGTSSSAAQHIAGGAVQISRKLSVGYLLEGSVQQDGELVRVGVNLTNGTTGFSEWSQQVQRPLGDIFAFESEIARAVSTALSVRMATDAPAPGGTRNATAYEAYLRGKALYNLAKDEATDRQARANYEIAISADPAFALAHAALSRVLSSLAASEAAASELKSLYASAIAEARRATELAPTSAEGHLALGYALFSGRLDVRGARPSYDQAYRYGRGNADIVLLCAAYMVRMRRFDEARAASERALALDPLNPRTHRAAGSIAFASRRYKDALAQYQQALALNPQMSNAKAGIGDALLELGQIDEARTAYAAEPKAMFRLRGVAILEHRAGKQAAAEAALTQLLAEVGDAAMYQQAEVMAQWGRTDEALARLDRARAIGDSGLIMVATDPLLDPISKDARFLRLVSDLGFT